MGAREAYLMNKAILIGRLTRDPEVRYTQSGVAVCTFTLAVDRRFARRDANDGQPTADFIPIVTWRKLAEICGNNLIKGRRISVEGRIQVRNYEAQDGSRRYVTEVVANLIALPLGTHAQPGSSGTTADWSQFGTVEAEESPKPKKPEYEMETIPF